MAAGREHGVTHSQALVAGAVLGCTHHAGWQQQISQAVVDEEWFLMD
jgi:hypothetical protein